MHSGLRWCNIGWEPRLASATISFTGLCQIIQSDKIVCSLEACPLNSKSQILIYLKLL